MDDDTTVELLGGAVELLGFGLIALALTLGAMSYALYRAGSRRLTAALVTALAILAAVALVIYGIGGEARAEAVALGSLAIGALAATLGQLAGASDNRTSDTPQNEPGEG